MIGLIFDEVDSSRVNEFSDGIELLFDEVGSGGVCEFPGMIGLLFDEVDSGGVCEFSDETGLLPRIGSLSCEVNDGVGFFPSEICGFFDGIGLSSDGRDFRTMDTATTMVIAMQMAVIAVARKHALPRVGLMPRITAREPKVGAQAQATRRIHATTKARHMAVQIICGIHSWKNVGASEEALLGLPELIMSVFLCTLAFLQEKNEIK